jgi:hypothetical protein
LRFLKKIQFFFIIGIKKQINKNSFFELFSAAAMAAAAMAAAANNFGILKVNILIEKYFIYLGSGSGFASV